MPSRVAGNTRGVCTRTGVSVATDTLTRKSLDTKNLPPLDQQVFDWLTTRFGASPSEFNRVLRWRTGWEATVRVNGKDQGVLVRASRGKAFKPPIPLQLEARLHDVMEAHGVLVPHVYGMIEDPLAIVMEKLPGGINTELIEDPDDRWQVRREFVEMLARLHAAPIEDFGVAGMLMPSDPARGSLEYYKYNCQHVRRAVAGRPIPFLEFLERWLERHMPADRTRMAFVTADSAQFLHDDERCTGLIDFEMAYIGDPAAEFAGFRVRDTTEPLGDIGRLRDHYEAVTGDHITRKLIAYHTAGYAGTAGFITWPLAIDCDADVDFIAYLQFTMCMCRWGLQGVMEFMDLSSVPIAEPVANTVVPFPFASTQGKAMATSWQTDDKALRYHFEAAAALAQYMERCTIYGQSILAADLADTRELTGSTAGTRAEADQVVSDWIQRQAGAEDEVRLVQFFDRWFQRQNFLLMGCGTQAVYTGRWLQRIAPRPGE
jgi:aminoglycoside phosphotransferase (APT) family kinase protein